MSEKKEFDLSEVPSFVDNVHISGLKRTKDIYVKKEIKDIFTSQSFSEVIIKAAELRQKLFDLGCFKSVEIHIDASKNKDSANCYDVHFEVEELSAVTGGIHTSIGNNEGNLSTSVSLPNLFGKGEKLSFEYSYGTRNNNDYRLIYQTPVNLNPNKIFSISAFKTLSEFPWSKFRHNEIGINLNISTPFSLLLGKRFLFNGKHNFSYEGIWRHLISSFDAAFDIREQSGHTLKSALKYEFVIDKRENRALPNDGGYLKTALELAGMGGDVKFFKANNDYQYTKTILKYFTTQLSFSSGFMVPFDSEQTINICDKFFLGGPLSLRGFSMRGAGPHKDDCSLGNDGYWLFGAHLYTPLPFFHKEEKLSSWFKTHSFLNVGNIFSLNSLRTNENKFDYLTQDARLSVGTGIVVRFANIARIELNYVWPLWKQQNDKFVNGLQFGIGIAFN